MPYIIEKTFNSEIFTKVGTPTITADGIASGFSDNDFIRISSGQNINLTKSFKIDLSFKTTAQNIEQYILRTSTTYLWIFITSGNNLSVRLGTSAWGSDIINAVYRNISINTDYKLSIEFTGTEYKVSLNDNVFYTKSTTSVIPVADAGFTFAKQSGNNYFRGSIDLKQFKITVDGKVVLNGTTSKEVYVLPSIQELKDYYSNTLIVQYHDKPKAKQTIEMLVYLVFSEMLLFQVQNAFNWKTAVGKQLDIIGQWVGVSRTFNINLLTEPKLAYPQYDRLDPDTTSALQGGYSDYESFDTLQGGQLRYSDIQTTTNNLNDDNYRIIIGLKIIFNSINHTAKAIDDAIWEYFNHEVYTVWTDNTLTYYYPSNLAQVMLFADYKGVLPAPTGVTVQLTEI